MTKKQIEELKTQTPLTRELVSIELLNEVLKELRKLKKMLEK